MINTWSFRRRYLTLVVVWLAGLTAIAIWGASRSGGAEYALAIGVGEWHVPLTGWVLAVTLAVLVLVPTLAVAVLWTFVHRLVTRRSRVS